MRLDNSTKSLIAALLLSGTAMTASGQAHSGAEPQEYNGEQFQRPLVRPPATDRIIIKWRDAKGQADTSAARLQKATSLSGRSWQKQQSLSGEIDVMQTQQRLSGEALNAMIARLQADPDIEYASADLRRHAHALTSDPLLAEQWYLLSAQPAATRTEQAWDVTTSNPATIVAVLDTGVRFDHPDLGRSDLGGKMLAGYDFVTNATFANDGDGRDGDPSDPGDWVSAADRQQPDFDTCEEGSSSWHGTRVAGLIGALTNNANGVAGAAWNSLVLPVRVLGKCGGFDADIIAGMRWAAGLSIPNVPSNPNPAQVINLSLGGEGICSAAYQDAVNEIIATRRVVIVVSAGNDGGPVSAPANCAGVLGVAGLRHIGTKVGFSNLGPELSLGAPAGNCVNTGPGQPCLFSIIVATNTGATTPLAPTYTSQLNVNVGTSFSAPQAAAASALMRSVNSQLTPSQLISLLKRSASPFPVNGSATVPTCHVPANSNDLQAAECNCTTATCGAGMLHSGAAVAAAVRPYAILQTAGTVVSGATLSLDASRSFASNGRSLTSFQWSVHNLTGSAAVVMAPAQASTTMQITGTSEFTLRLTVSDDQGGEAVEELALATPAPPPPVTPPAIQPANSGGGGGGQFDCELLGLLLLAGALRRIRRRNR